MRPSHVLSFDLLVRRDIEKVFFYNVVTNDMY